jgi:hypothetical protein
MRVTLSPSWELSTEHAASQRDQPVLVKRSTKEAFRPRDMVRVYPAWGFLPAAQAVARLATLTRLDPEAQALVTRFVGGKPNTGT